MIFSTCTNVFCLSTPKNIVIFIDGQPIDCSQSTSLTYGEKNLYIKQPRSKTRLNTTIVYENKLQDRVPQLDYNSEMENDMQLKALRNSTLVRTIPILWLYAKLKSEIQDAESPVSKHYPRLDSNNEEENGYRH